MRILIVAGHFAGHDRTPWLIDDLADQLVTDGHEVDVIVADATRGGPSGLRIGTRPGLRVFGAGDSLRSRGRLRKLIAYLRTGWRLHTVARQFAQGPYDLGVYTSIASFSWGLPGRLRRSSRIACLMLILWDFFPVHQVEIGRINPVFAGLAKRAERAAIRDADLVALMSAANVRFFEEYFPDSRAETMILPPWSSSGIEALNDDRWSEPTMRVVFGGQLTAGRGVATLIDAFRILTQESTFAAVELVIAGDGPTREQLEERARGLSVVRFTGPLPRAEYRDLLATAHLGIAVTVPQVSPPSFPSKIVEYAGLGIPIVVAVEGSSDAGTLVEAHGAGWAVPAGDVDALADAIREAAAELRDGRLHARAAAARRYWDGDLSVRRAALKVVEAVGP